MKLEYIEPFVTSAVNVLQAVLHSPVEPGDIALLRGNELNGEVSVVIGLRDHPGENVILNMNREAALNISAAMNGAVSPVLDETGMDAVGELANMIAGNAVSSLNDQGFDFSVQPPATVKQADLFRITDGLEVFQIPMTSSQGLITVNFTIRTN